MFKFLIIVIVTALLVYLGASTYSAVAAIKIPRRPLDGSPTSVGLVYEDISFLSRDDVTLKGWYIPATGKSTIVMVSGGMHNRYDPTINHLELARDLAAKGFNILMFDQRGRGESEGKSLLLVKSNQDIGGAVDYIKSRGCENITIMGFSLGAASSLIFVGGESIGAVVSDSSFANVKEMFIKQAVIDTGLPEPIIEFCTPGTILMIKIIYGYSVVNPIDIVADISYPILFIHEEADDRISVEDAYELFKASGNPSDELWVVPDAGHCQGYKSDPGSYVDKVAVFLGEN